jgi:uncharacterized phosphosugar-binding protein
MEKITLDVFYDKMLELVDKLETTQMDNMIKAAEICAEAMMNDGAVHIFGSGHSVGFGLELKGRPGSLVPFHMIETSDFVTKGMYTLEEFRDQDNIFERRSGIANKLYDLYDVRPQDAFIIISNSGINGLVIDLAITAKDKGHKVIVITSWDHTNSEPSRHVSGKKLYELGDVMIDNCGPQGDALLPTDTVAKVTSISSITGAFIAQSLTAEICRIYQEQNKIPPILYSFEVEGYQEHNQALLEKYDSRW